jgi:hypothetical protein
MTVVLAPWCGAVVVPLALLIWQVVANGRPAIGLEFFTQIEPLSYRERGGRLPARHRRHPVHDRDRRGVTIPLGVAAAVYLNEYGSGRYAARRALLHRRDDRVPSVFVGLAVYALLVSGANGLGLGFGTFAGAVALASSCCRSWCARPRRCCASCPSSSRTPAYGLGARRWQTVTRVVLPAAAPGITTGCDPRGRPRSGRDGAADPHRARRPSGRHVVLGRAAGRRGVADARTGSASRSTRDRTCLGRRVHPHGHRAGAVDRRPPDRPAQPGLSLKELCHPNPAGGRMTQVTSGGVPPHAVAGPRPCRGRYRTGGRSGSGRRSSSGQPKRPVM